MRRLWAWLVAATTLVLVVVVGLAAPAAAVALTATPGFDGWVVDGSATPVDAPAEASAHRYDDARVLARGAGSGASSSAVGRGAATSGTRALPAGPQPRAAIGPGDNPGSLNTVIGKVDDLKAPGAIRSGERSLLSRLPKQGSPKANYVQNSSVLRQEMSRGVPIRDATVDPLTGQLTNNSGFLRAERDILVNGGWAFDPKTGYWNPG